MPIAAARATMHTVPKQYEGYFAASTTAARHALYRRTRSRDEN